MKMCGLLSKNQVNSTIKSTKMFSLSSVVSQLVTVFFLLATLLLEKKLKFCIISIKNK